MGLDNNYLSDVPQGSLLGIILFSFTSRVLENQNLLHDEVPRIDSSNPIDTAQTWAEIEDGWMMESPKT